MKKIILILLLVVIVSTKDGQILFPEDKCTKKEYDGTIVLDCKVEEYCKSDDRTFTMPYVTYTQNAKDVLL